MYTLTWVQLAGSIWQKDDNDEGKNQSKKERSFECRNHDEKNFGRRYESYSLLNTTHSKVYKVMHTTFAHVLRPAPLEKPQKYLNLQNIMSTMKVMVTTQMIASNSKTQSNKWLRKKENWRNMWKVAMTMAADGTEENAKECLRAHKVETA